VWNALSHDVVVAFSVCLVWNASSHDVVVAFSVCLVWNASSHDVVVAFSVISFKRKLDTGNLDLYTRY